ncbi:MAG: hypothetical protein HQM09_07565 [Candidatus Riflebacteria bacterium]|nr:hypothetical protein [Candidatus Riflebacteria bacterium]
MSIQTPGRLNKLLKWAFWLSGPAVLLIVGAFFFTTTWGTSFVVERFTDVIAAQQGMDLRIEGLSGSFYDGIQVRQIVGFIRRARLNFVLNALEIGISWRSLISGNARIASIVCEKAHIQGPPSPAWMETLPPLPGAKFGCLAFPPLRFQIDRLRVMNIEWQTNASGPSLLVHGLELDPAPATGKRGMQPFRMALSGNWYGEPVITTEAVGSFSMSELSLEGILDGCSFGTTFRNEFHAHFDHEKCTIDGYLDIPMIDIASLSHRFEGLWIDKWPLKATGTLSLAGSWLVNSGSGFTGNIRGKASRLGIIITGLNMSLMEISAEAMIHQDHLQFTDSGSLFFGRPARIEGGIEFSKISQIKSDLHFLVDDFSVEDFVASLPWALRYGLGLPELSGTAGLKIHLTGVEPMMHAALSGDALEIHKGTVKANLNGKCEIRSEGTSLSNIHISFQWLCNEGIPTLLARLTGEKGSVVSHPPVSFQAVLTGSSTQLLNLIGTFTINGKTIPISGRQIDGKLENLRFLPSENTAFIVTGGTISKVAPHSPVGSRAIAIGSQSQFFAPEGFLPSGVTLGDLALLSGW